MANYLKMAKISAILTLKEHGWSQRRIARELGIHPDTVGRYIRLSGKDPKPAINAPPGSEDSKQDKTPTGSGYTDACNETSGRSQCEPLRKVIEDKLEYGLSCQRIYQDLRDEYGFKGSYYSVRRFVKRLGENNPIPFRRMECIPGEQAQVDFGTGAPVVSSDGKRRRPHVFRIVLSFSRKGYSEVVYRQTTDNFIRCLENAFWYFGGIPRTLIIDNLKAAVKNADWYDPDIHPKIQSFCEHYGTVVLPTKAYTPRHKGKIERGIGYVKDNALKGRMFSSLTEQNKHLLHWETYVADTRIHGTTRKQVGKLFTEEKSSLLPLPASRFPCFTEGKRSVHRDGHVEVQKSYYSVPPEYVGREVWARWDGHLVRIFNCRMEQIAVHVQVEPGKFQTMQKHIHSQKSSKIEKGTLWMLQRASLIGDNADRWAQAMLKARGIPGIRVLVGLLNLVNRYDSDSIDKACEIALTHNAFRLKTIRGLIQRGGSRQQELEFIDEHPIIRNMSDYEAIVKRTLM
ncbi:IS21 family transposase [Planctomycetota bacterium]